MMTAAAVKKPDSGGNCRAGGGADSGKESCHEPQASFSPAWSRWAPPAHRVSAAAQAADSHFVADAKYTANEITQAGADFFGITTEAMAKAVQHVFGDLGQPDAYIKGDEGSGAFVVGLRYGSGWLIRKNARAA